MENTLDWEERAGEIFHLKKIHNEARIVGGIDLLRMDGIFHESGRDLNTHWMAKGKIPLPDVAAY